MNRRECMSLIGSVTGLAALLALASEAHAAPTAAMFAHCAKACKDCMQACQACNTHCVGMVKGGQKEHEKSLKLSADCRDICDVAAKLCQRQGPLTAAICEACIKACDACGAECKKYPNMKPMADCEKACVACAKACKEMIAALK